MKKQSLNAFDLYDYLNPDRNVPFFLANQHTYQAAAIEFPFRNSFYGIGITYTGYSGEVNIGGATYPVQKGSLITIGPGTLSKWSTDYSSEHDTLFFTEELFDRTIKMSNLKMMPFFKPSGQHVISLDEGQQSQMKILFDAVKAFQHQGSLIPGLVYAILQFTIHCHKLLATDRSPNSAQHQKIMKAFTTLLIQHFLQHQSVNFYAEKLHITPKYLSEVLLKLTGKGAKEHIVELLLLEAKSLLKQTDMSVRDIASWLGYADSSYFTKLFKKQTGLTPLAYKQQ